MSPYLCSQLNKLLRAKVAAGDQHAWWPKSGKIDPLEKAILGVLTEISQVSDAPVLDGVVNLFLFSVE